MNADNVHATLGEVDRVTSACAGEGKLLRGG